MSVTIKTAHEIQLMRESGHLLCQVHDALIPYIKPGMKTSEIDKIGEEKIRSLGCIPNFLHYHGFPASFCISLNDEVVHGIPSDKKVLKEGDIVKIDAGLIYESLKKHSIIFKSDWNSAEKNGTKKNVPGLQEFHR